MPEIQIIAKDSHDTLSTIKGTSAKLSEASVVLVKVAASDVLVVNRREPMQSFALKTAKLLLLKASLVEQLSLKITALFFKTKMDS